jgi:hypothetical protein
MKHQYRPLPPAKSVVRRGRLALWFCGLMLIAIGCVRLLQGQFAYISISGTIFTPLLIVLGLFVISIAVFSHPKKRP